MMVVLAVVIIVVNGDDDDVSGTLSSAEAIVWNRLTVHEGSCALTRTVSLFHTIASAEERVSGNILIHRPPLQRLLECDTL
jgi:hypothetical protein